MNKIIITGKAASGKDYIRKQLEKSPFISYAPPFTTRPARMGEVNGVDYYFLDDITYDKMEQNGSFVVSNEFNGWKYGITYNQIISNKNLFILSPRAIQDIPQKYRDEFFIIYIDVAKDVIIDRLKTRPMPGDTSAARIARDDVDFELFLKNKQYDLIVKDENKSDLIDMILKLVLYGEHQANHY